MNIKSFFIKIWTAVKSLFNQFPSEIKVAVHIAVSITENFKAFIDSPIADMMTFIIPGDVDDKLKILLRAQLPIILTKLKLVDANVDDTDLNAIIDSAIETLKKTTPEIKAAFLHNLAVLLSQIAADGKLSWSDGVCVVEWYYKNEFNTAVN